MSQRHPASLQDYRLVAVVSVVLFSIIPAAWCASFFLDLVLNGVSDWQKHVFRCSMGEREEIDIPVMFLGCAFVISIMIGTAIVMNLLPRRYAGILPFGLVFLLSSGIAISASQYFYHLEQEVLREGLPCQ